MNALLSRSDADIIADFVTDCRLRDMTEKSIQSYLSCIKIFTEFMKRRRVNLAQVSREELKLFLHYLRTERGVKQKTVKEYFSALSALWGFMVDEGMLQNNIVLPFRRRYLKQYKAEYEDERRKLLTVEEMSLLVNSILDPRDKAIAVLFAKTGIRRSELQAIDLNDIDWSELSITLKPTKKRSNRVVFFDDECAFVLKRWISVRNEISPRTDGLFISYQTLERLDRNGIYSAITKYATRLGLHDPSSRRLEDHFGPHCFRHWFTTWLLRRGMRREYVKELRGDRRREAIDIYDHLDMDEVRREYLSCIPKLGLYLLRS